MRVQKTEVLRAAEVMWEPQCCGAPELGSMRALRGLTPIRGGHAAGPGACNGDEQRRHSVTCHGLRRGGLLSPRGRAFQLAAVGVKRPRLAPHNFSGNTKFSVL
jgi:hypothetical protein